jgi:hypothetical protein
VGELEEVEAGEVLGVDEADDFVIFIDDDDIIDAMFVEGAEDFGGDFISGNGDGAGGHVIAEGLVGDIAIFLVAADEIAMGKNAFEFSVGINDDDGAGAGFAHGFEGGLDGGIGGSGDELIAGAHDIADAGEEGASEAAAGVELGEIFIAEAAGFEEDHGEGVAEDEHIGGAAGGSEVKGAGFAFDIDVEDDVAVSTEGGIGGAGESDEFGGETFEVGEEVEEFIGFAAVAEGDDGVALADDAEVAVEGVLGIEDDGGGAGGIEGGGDFMGDIVGFSDTDDDDFTVIIEGFLEGLDGGGKAVVDASEEALEFIDFDFDDALGFGEVVHGQANTLDRN